MHDRSRRLFIQASGTACLAAATPALTWGQPAADPLPADFLARLPQMMAWANVPGLSFAIIRDGKVALARGFGVREAGGTSAVDADTVFPGASLSKPLFAYAVLKLRDQKLLDLDRPLMSYLQATDLPNDPRTALITARHALTHTIGWQNWRNTREPTLQFEFKPGEKFRYSGEGFFLLQRVVEHLADSGFEDLMRRTVFDPLGMKQSSFIQTVAHQGAVGHNARGVVADATNAQQRQRREDLANFWALPQSSWRYDDQVRALKTLYPNRQPFPDALATNSAGSLVTTATEYAQFMLRLMDGAPSNEAGLAEASRREMLTPQVEINSALSWGVGVGLQRDGGRTCYWQWGDNGSWKTFMFGDPAARSGVAVFANGANGDKLCQRVVAQATGRDQPAFLYWMV
jgi:CubicO group peptidase (beta-lactamase class C family)